MLGRVLPGGLDQGDGDAVPAVLGVDLGRYGLGTVLVLRRPGVVRCGRDGQDELGQAEKRQRGDGG
ncbi:hypothetical protein Psuf_054190 [Phytohabitans suffuscus]|uniref:Uncharacterized protein n=1 Tax=Phytohabitans suffuscus TaxID=624315 RepID=A0A6F8YPX8_9ACTN|nr:hypothetical protein Psuf_054190 [Phytohabitans suffuscus]